MKKITGTALDIVAHFHPPLAVLLEERMKIISVLRYIEKELRKPHEQDLSDKLAANQKDLLNNCIDCNLMCIQLGVPEVCILDGKKEPFGSPNSYYPNKI